MPVKIRLRRMGRKKQPHYRIVVADSRSPRDGRFVESIGYYKPLTRPARIVLDLERVDFWIGKGAQPSNTVRTLVNKARKGGDDTVAVGEVDREAEKARRSEELAAKRRAEAEAAAKAEEEAKLAKEAAAAVEAEAEAAAAEAEAASEEESAEPAAEAGEEPEAAAETSSDEGDDASEDAAEAKEE